MVFPVHVNANIFTLVYKWPKADGKKNRFLPFAVSSFARAVRVYIFAAMPPGNEAVKKSYKTVC